MKILLIIAIFTSSCQHGINGIIEKGKNRNKVDGSRKHPGVVDDVMQVSSSAEDDFPDVMFVQTKSSFPRIPGILQAAGHVIRDAAEVIKNDAKAKLEQIQTHLSNAMPAAPEPAFAGEANNFKSDPSFRHKMMSKSKSDEARVVARKEMASESENGGVKKEMASKGGNGGVKKEMASKGGGVKNEEEVTKLVAETKQLLSKHKTDKTSLTAADKEKLIDRAYDILQTKQTKQAMASMDGWRGIMRPSAEELDALLRQAVSNTEESEAMAKQEKNRVSMDHIQTAMKKFAEDEKRGSPSHGIPERKRMKVFTVGEGQDEGVKVIEGLQPGTDEAEGQTPNLKVVADGVRKTPKKDSIFPKEED